MRLAFQRYEEIKLAISNLLEDYDIKKLPIDVFELARKMNIKIVFASNILNNHPKKVDEYILFKYPHSYLIYIPETQKFVVYLDDVGTKRKRQRFSLAHEIIHIILGHTDQNDENESEANFGATYLLCPTSFALTQINSDLLLNENVIEEIFDVSSSEAKIIARYNCSRLSKCDLKEKNYETTINNLFKESLSLMLNRYIQKEDIEHQ